MYKMVAMVATAYLLVECTFNYKHFQLAVGWSWRYDMLMTMMMMSCKRHDRVRFNVVDDDDDVGGYWWC